MDEQNLPDPKGSFNLDSHGHLGLTDPSVFEIDRPFKHFVAEPLRDVGHLDLEQVSVGAHRVQGHSTQSLRTPYAETPGCILHPQAKDRLRIEVPPAREQYPSGPPAFIK